MIRYEINSDDCQFIDYRPGIDQDNYRVGRYKNKVIVQNIITGLIMDFYYDDHPEIEWFDLKLIDTSMSGYLIKRDGTVRGLKKKSLTHYISHSGYPSCLINRHNKPVHRLLASLFIPNIDFESNVVVDHIDRNRLNMNLSNLRWCTLSENAKNSDKPKWFGRHIYIAYSDKDYKTELFRINDEEFHNRYPVKSAIGHLSDSMMHNRKYRGYYWKRIDLNLKDYLQKIGVQEIDENLWVLHYSGDCFVHPVGLVKSTISLRSYPTPGKIRGIKHQDRVFSKKAVHRLVAEVFLNGNLPLDKQYVVDHINTDPLDNRVENLRICTQQENLQNPLSLRKRYKAVIDPNGIEYESVNECAIALGMKPAAISGKLSKKDSGFKYK